MFLAYRLKRMTPRDAAVFWTVRADCRSLKPGEQLLFDAWRADPEHARAHADVQELYVRLGNLKRHWPGPTA